MRNLLLSLCLLPFIAKGQELSVSDYFYPMNVFQYTTKIAGNQSGFIRKEYKISNSRIGQFLETKTELYQNLYNHTTTAQEAFVLSNDNNKNAIISDKQVYYNKLTGPQNRTDHLTLFILPDSGKVEKWFESNRDEKFSCTAEYVDISFNGLVQGQKAKAVKITKINKLDNEEIKTWSYWLPNYSRIATFEQRGKNEIRIVEVSDMLDSDPSITEISKSLKLSYEEPQKKVTSVEKTTTPVKRTTTPVKKTTTSAKKN